MDSVATSAPATPASAAPAATRVPLIAGLEVRGQLNLPEAQILEHVRASIRRGHPQVWRCNERPERIALVGSGPSLEATFDELRALVFDGAKLVTVNGAYRWCLERNLKPHAQIVIDARAENARFVEPAVPGCRYYLASQCHAAIWDAVEGREFVGIFHALGDDKTLEALLNEFYLERWQGVLGGTTVLTRALGVLRLLGFLRYDLFGIDCCWLDGVHHAFPQPENDRDVPVLVDVAPEDALDQTRTFTTSPWMVKQAMDILELIRAVGDLFLLNVHGDGLLAYMLRTSGDVVDARAVDLSPVNA